MAQGDRVVRIVRFFDRRWNHIDLSVDDSEHFLRELRVVRQVVLVADFDRASVGMRD